MIKILFYIDELSAGGAEKVLCNLVNNMDRSVFDITVHTTWKSDAESLLNKDITYKYVYEKRNKTNRFLYRAEAQLGLFYQLHLKGNYDIEVAYLECGPTKVMASSTNKKAVHLAWIHCDLERKISDMQKFVNDTKKHYQKYDKVICVSDDCEKTYRKYFSDCAPSQVIYNVIDSDEILKKAETKVSIPFEKKKLTAIAVGRMAPEKNYSMLLDVHKQLIHEGLDYELWMLGEGIESDKLKEYVNDNHLQNNVRFFGFQKNPYPMMKEADFLVCSSKYEGYSTVVIEAMILGIPVLTVECGSGMREILGNSEYGLITENNEQALKEGMRLFLENSELRNEYKKKALIRAQQLSGKKAAEKTETCFMQYLKEKQK